MSRAHSLSHPEPHDATPIFISDNTSQDCLFLVDEDDIRRGLQHLPKDDWSTIAQAWLRRFKKSDYESGERPLAESICGSGVRVIVLFPWPADRRISISKGSLAIDI